LELVVADTEDEPLVARHPEIPAPSALQGFDGVRAFAGDAERSRGLLEDVLELEAVDGGGWEARGPTRGGRFGYDAPPAGAGLPGAGTVHHGARATAMEDHERTRRPGAERR